MVVLQFFGAISRKSNLTCKYSSSFWEAVPVPTLSTVVNAGTKLEILATNELNESTLSTPAISAGKLFIRTDGNLYCVGK